MVPSEGNNDAVTLTDNQLSNLAGAALADAAGGQVTSVAGSDSISSGGNDSVVAQGDAAQGLSEQLNGAGTGPTAEVVDFAAFVGGQVDAAFAAHPIPAPVQQVTVPPVTYCVSITCPNGDRVALDIDTNGGKTTTDLDHAHAVTSAALAHQESCAAVVEVVDNETAKLYGLEVEGE